MTKVAYTRMIASPAGVIDAGEICEVTPTEARRLVASGDAVRVDRPTDQPVRERDLSRVRAVGRAVRIEVDDNDAVATARDRVLDLEEQLLTLEGQVDVVETRAAAATAVAAEARREALQVAALQRLGQATPTEAEAARDAAQEAANEAEEERTAVEIVKVQLEELERSWLAAREDHRRLLGDYLAERIRPAVARYAEAIAAAYAAADELHGLYGTCELAGLHPPMHDPSARFWRTMAAPNSDLSRLIAALQDGEVPIPDDLQRAVDHAHGRHNGNGNGNGRKG